MGQSDQPIGALKLELKHQGKARSSASAEPPKTIKELQKENKLVKEQHRKVMLARHKSSDKAERHMPPLS